MAEPLDIHAVLENGFFTTSRAKSVQPSSPPRLPPPSSSPPLPSSLPNDTSSKSLALRRPRTRPPPPTCEDEIDALAKEYGALSVSDDEVQERGEFEQHPILLEVHEHNPERRFVLVPEGSDLSEGQVKDESSDSERRRRNERSQDDRPKTPTIRHEPVFEDSLKAEDGRPSLSRRRSRHGDLPPIDTNSRQDIPPPRPRTRSAVGSRPEGFSARQSARFGDEMLSPDVIKSGSARREPNYYSGSSTAGPRKMHHQRSYSNMVDDRREKPQRRESLSPGYGARSESNPAARKPSRRRMSTERDPRYRDEPSGPRSSSRRESTLSSRRPDAEGVPTSRTSKPLGPRGPRKEESRSSEDQSTAHKTSGRRRGNSASIHQDVPPRVLEKDASFRDDRSRSREPTAAAYVPASAVPKDTPVNPRATATFPLTSDDTSTRLPYPDDVRSNRPPAYNGQQPPTASMPNISNGVPANTGKPLNPGNTFDARGTPTTANATAWPPQFVPERDGLPTDRKNSDRGDFRRFSEGEAVFGVSSFPDCQRVEPVAGKMDWLTLPHTDFNICSDCYQAVFYNTDYRASFQPMLRPTDRPISCDFGSSPWYRIAYLLTRKLRRPDLQLFHQVDAVATTMKNQPCPGSRKALRNWYGIRDPHKRRAVPNFTACLQCAKTVEVLLPNLMGVFVPLDSRSEPVGSVCSLHFKPQRRRFAQYFDTLANTSDTATSKGQPPDLSALASEIERLSALGECRQDIPMLNAYWHTMQCLPEMSVCASCFDEFVRPKLSTETLARNFYRDTQKMREATCQLYSKRMRDVFDEACRHNDPRYLQETVRKRVLAETDIRSQLMKLDREGKGDAWADAQIEHLVSEWRNKWE